MKKTCIDVEGRRFTSAITGNFECKAGLELAFKTSRFRHERKA